MMPARAVGSRTETIVRDFVTPSARLASRTSRGTSRSISSVARTISGTMTNASASAPA